jgi:predicted NBD/HSP70 family sugar kinase/biotin operon repressor
MSHSLAVLEALCRRGEASRAQLAQETGLSPATISRAVAYLRGKGLAVENAEGGNRVGRPPRVVQLRPDAAYVVGIDAGGSRIRVVLTDLEGEPKARGARMVRGGTRIDAFARAIAGLVADVAGEHLGSVVAAGAGISGIVDAARGTVLLSPDLPVLNGKAVASCLTDALRLPVSIDNDDLLAAAGEAAFGAAQGCSEVAFLSLGHGLGAGLIVGGRPVRGARSSAGAIAYLAPDPLGERASGRAIPRRYLERRGIRGGRTTAERVFELAASGDAVAGQVIDEAIRALGDLVVNVAAMIDPQVIVLGGGLVRGQPSILGAMEARLGEALPFPPALVASALGEDAVARGAASLALTVAQRHLAGETVEPGRLGALRFV